MNDARRQFRRGLSLVASMWIIVALTGLVLSMAYSVRLEALASANRTASAQAEAAARGAEQYLLAAMDQELATFGTMKNMSFEARPIGDCYVWFVNNVPGGSEYGYGPTDEGGKFNLNLINLANTDKRRFYNMLMALPEMTDEQANSMIDWRDSDTSPYGSTGAEESYYSTQNPQYRAKNGDFESVEELLLVKGFSFSTLYGNDTNRNGIIDEGEAAGNDATHGVGLAPYVTAYGVATRNAAQQQPGQPPQPATTTFKINLNSASVEVLKALFSYGGDTQTAESVAKDLVAHRENTNTSDPTEIVRWLQTSKPQIYNQVSRYVNSRTSTTTPPTLVYSADIVAVTRDGRAFKRYRVVAQGSQSSANVTKIVFRQDITAAGWPLDPQIRTDLRNGNEPSTGVRSVNK